MVMVLAVSKENESLLKDASNFKSAMVETASVSESVLIVN
jgi:hypothetical protein